MARRLLALVMLVALVLGIGLVRWDPTGEPEFCTLEGKLVEPPPGWDLRRDHFNDCAWTLFSESGDRAPDELYREMSLDPPPEYPYDWDALGWVLIVGALVGGAAILPQPRPSPPSTITSGNEPAA